MATLSQCRALGARAAAAQQGRARITPPPAARIARAGVLGISEHRPQLAGRRVACRASSESYLATIKELGESGDWEGAVATLAAINKDAEATADSAHFEAIIAACEKAGEWLKALEMLTTQRVLGIPPTEETYLSIMRSCQIGEQYDKPLEIVEMMREDHSPGIHTYTEAMFLASIDKSRPWEKAQKLMNKLEAEGPAPSQRTWTYYISLLGKARQIDEVKRLLGIHRKHFTMDQELYGMYNVLISNTLKMGDGDQADMFMEERDYLYD